MIKRGIIGVSIVLLLTISYCFLILTHFTEENTVEAYTHDKLGDVSTNLLTMNFDEDYECESGDMKYDPSYTYNQGGIDPLTDDATKTVYDYSGNEYDGILSAGPGGQYNELGLDCDNHDTPKRTHLTTQGRAVDFWVPPEGDFYTVSECRYVKIPYSSSLKMVMPPYYQQLNNNYYDFEFLLWVREVDESYGDRVLINNLWSKPFGLTTVQGWYRIKLNSDNQLVFEYPYQNVNPTMELSSTTSLNYNEWNRINVRVILPAYGFHIPDWGIHVEIYINGERTDSLTSLTYPSFYDPFPLSKALTIGADPYSIKYEGGENKSDCMQFNGIIDEIRIGKGYVWSYDFWADGAEDIGRQLFFIDFDEQGGSRSLDQTPLDHDATLYNDTASPWGSDGVYGGYLNCHTNNSYYSEITDWNTENNGPQEITIETWINPDEDFEEIVETAHTNIVSKAYNPYSSPYYSFYLKIAQNRKIVFGVGANSPNQDLAVVSQNIVPVDEWTYIAGTFKEGVLKLYINGILENTTTYIWSGRSIPYYSSNPYYFGIYQHRTNLDFPGKIDQVGLYDYVRVFSPEIMRYEFNDGSSSPAIPTTDWTPFGYDGDLKNGATIVNDGGKYGNGINYPSTETNPHVEISVSSNSEDPNYIGGEFTVDCWVKPESTLSGPSAIVSQYEAWELGMDSNEMPYFKVRNTVGTWITASHTLPLINDYDIGSDKNTWHHLMGVFRNDQIYVFLDGKSGYGDSEKEFTGTRAVSTNSIYLGLRYTGSVYEAQYNGLMDSFRFRKGLYDLTEDTDGDGMSDKYEVIRSLHSDQFDPFEHNTRFAFLFSAVTDSNDSYDPFLERHFKLESYGLRDALVKQGYDDDDIIYLDNDYLFTEEGHQSVDWYNPSVFYENGPWIDGSPTITNFNNALDKLRYGGAVNLQVSTYSGGVWDEDNKITVPKLEESDNFYFEVNGHGFGGTDGNDYYLETCERTTPVGNYITVNLNGGNIKTRLDNINCKYSTVVVSSCFSGNLIAGSVNLQKSNRILVTSSASGESAWIAALFFSSRMKGESFSPKEYSSGYASPGSYSGLSNMVQFIKWGYNADDLYEWTYAYQGTPPAITSPYIIYYLKEDNTRNIIVSVQEAYNFAKHWVEFRVKMGAQNPHGLPSMIEGTGVGGQLPDHVVV